MTNANHYRILNRLLKNVSPMGAFCLAFSTLAHKYGENVTEGQMIYLATARSVKHGIEMAETYWGKDLLTERCRSQLLKGDYIDAKSR